MSELSKGPELGRKPAPPRKGSRKKTGGMREQTELYIKGNAMQAFLVLMKCLFFLMLLYSLFTMSKTILCPDFANANKNPAWYCKK